MTKNLTEGDFAIDVGANCGQCTVVMAARCGSTGRIVAFEPNPDARKVLQRNFELNPSVKRAVIESFACSDVADGEAELYQNGNSSNSSLVRLTVPSDDNETSPTFRVKTTTLDAYFSDHGFPQPRLVKIDAEGAEIRILRSARNLLSSRAVILCQLHPYAWPQFGNSLRELEAMLAESGRCMRYLDQESEPAGDMHYGIVALERAR